MTAGIRAWDDFAKKLKVLAAPPLPAETEAAALRVERDTWEAAHTRQAHETGRQEARARVAEKAVAALLGEPILAEYTNWRGERSIRTFTPRRVFWGSNEWHPEPQVLIEAYDCDKEAVRVFAAAGFAATPQAAALQKRVVELEGAVAAERAACAWIAREIANVCNMLQNDNVEPAENIIRREVAFRIDAAIRARNLGGKP